MKKRENEILCLIFYDIFTVNMEAKDIDLFSFVFQAGLFFFSFFLF